MIAAARRMAAVGVSPTAAQAGGAPTATDVVDFASGELRVGPPPAVARAAAAQAGRPDLDRYGPMQGLPALRAAVADQLSGGSAAVAPDQVLITAGAKPALFHAMLAFVERGDEVLVPAPYWTSHPAMVRLAGGTPVNVPAPRADGFKVTPASLEDHRTERTRHLIFANPANPSGAVYSGAEVEAIGRWAQRHGLVVLSDEIYARLVHASVDPPSIAEAVPGLAGRCLRIGAMSKTYAMAGWRVGWLAGDREAVAVVAAVQSHAASHPANVAQAIALAVLEDGAESWTADARKALARRRRAMLHGLAAVPGVEVGGASDVYYAFPSVEAHLGRTIAGHAVRTTADLVAVLAAAGIAALPGEAFGAPGHLRLNYSLPDAELERGLARLRQVLDT
jgi:aspartate aminotransferase